MERVISLRIDIEMERPWADPFQVGLGLGLGLGGRGFSSSFPMVKWRYLEHIRGRTWGINTTGKRLAVSLILYHYFTHQYQYIGT